MPLNPEQQAALNDRMRNGHAQTINETLGIQLTDFDVDTGTITGTIKVSPANIQPYGILHGGASVVLAETLGSAGSAMLVFPDGKQAFGLEVNANHIRPAQQGDTITGVATLEHRGRTTHVWTIRLTNPAGKLTCLAKLTVAIR